MVNKSAEDVDTKEKSITYNRRSRNNHRVNEKQQKPKTAGNDNKKCKIRRIEVNTRTFYIKCSTESKTNADSDEQKGVKLPIHKNKNRRVSVG